MSVASGKIGHVLASHREYDSSPICYWHPRPGERPDLRRIGRRHPALAQRPPPWYRARPAALRRTGCPRCHGRSIDESAYAYLLGLYLGDGHIARGRRGVYVLSIACSDDWPGLLGTARRAMSAVMPASSVCCVQQPGCTAVKSYSKHWPCLFPAARAGAQAPSQNRAGPMAIRHRTEIPWRTRQRAVPFRWLAWREPGAEKAPALKDDGAGPAASLRRPAWP